MPNPLNNLFSQIPQQNNGFLNNIQNFQRIVSLLKSSNNPQAAIMQLAQQNPQMKQILNLCNGKNPKDVFIEECKNRGMNPDEIISQLGIK